MKKRATFKKGRTGRGKPKGGPPAALQSAGMVRKERPAASGTLKGTHFLRDALEEIRPRLRKAMREAADSIINEPRSFSMRERCPHCGNLAYPFNAREPEEGFYWARRKDGKMLLVQVHDDQGRKSVSFFDSGNRQGLRFIRESFVFVQRIEPPTMDSQG